MRSELAEQARRALLETVRRMTPGQRLAAFLAHCEAMAQLKAAGEQLRISARPRQSRT